MKGQEVYNIEVSPEYKEVDNADIQHMAYLKAKPKQAGSDGYTVGPNATKFDFLALFGLKRFR